MVGVKIKSYLALILMRKNSVKNGHLHATKHT